MTEFHWQRAFAWLPINVPGPRPGTRAILWLESIERRRVLIGRKFRWEYRAPSW